MAEKKEIMGMIDEAGQATEFLGNDGLGGLIILSALLTEFKLAEVIGAEAKKIKAATHYVTHNSPTETAMNDLVEIDNSVRGVLDRVCCIEEKVVEKLRIGARLRNAPEVE
ncbi:hypothetical protein LCM20_17120 [Halobacillus litoralis]|uniref:hypothetical protein n=1 Tax=Halobacillus litoralis TaxID=45668 RepID=UPI001CD4B65D|nr:hypothetical protein [Halobacillus litoralis]MCA0972332.1 hypothetical protein [Halobacillus litoralis]